MAPSPDPKSSGTDLEPPLILLVEDDDAVRTTAERCLGHAGYRVISAADPAQAAAKFRLARRRTDLLVADIVLPHRYGTVLYKELCQLQPNLKVLFISGFPDIGRGSGRTRLPGTPFLYKPFTAFDLRRAVARIIAGQEWSEEDATTDEPTLQPDRASIGADGTAQDGDDSDRSVPARPVSAGLLGV